MDKKTQYVLSIDSVAFARCFIVSDILAEMVGHEQAEYGLVGLAAKQDPFYVLATPLLHNQHVTAASVHQAGRDVFRLRDEMQILSKRLKKPLVPTAFIHRHPYAVGMSSIDAEFITSVFIDQVCTSVTRQENRTIQTGEFSCGCTEIGKLSQKHATTRTIRKTAQIVFGVCFSLIVNRERQFSIDAVRKEWCPFCKKPQVSLVSAALHVRPQRKLAEDELDKLRRHLEIEIEAKVKFERTYANNG